MHTSLPTATQGTSTGHRPSFHLRPATLDDAPAMARICMAAFASNPVSRGLYGPVGTSVSASEKMQAGMEKDLHPATCDEKVKYVVAELVPDATLTRMTTAANVAVTTDDGVNVSQRERAGANEEVFGFGKWHFHPTGQLPTHSKPPIAASSATFGEDTNLDLARAFFGGCHELRQRYIGTQPYSMLSILSVDPAMQGLGAGLALVQWGVQRAQDLGLDCWLTGTPAGYTTYRRCGFEELDVFDLDLGSGFGVWKTGAAKDWGEGLAVDVAGGLGRGCYRCVLMRRRVLGERDGGLEVGVKEEVTGTEEANEKEREKEKKGLGF